MDINQQASLGTANPSELRSYIGTAAYGFLGYTLLSKSFKHINRAKLFREAMLSAARPDYSKYVPLYEGFVGNQAYNADQVLNYYRSKGYFRQRPRRFEPSPSKHQTVFDVTPDISPANLADVVASAPDDSLVNVQKSTFGIYGGDGGEFTVGILPDNIEANDIKYAFSNFSEYAEFLSDAANSERFGSSSYIPTDVATGAKEVNNEFVKQYLDIMTNDRASIEARKSLEKQLPGFLATVNEISFNPDSVKDFGGQDTVRVSGVIQKQDKFLISVVGFNSETFGSKSPVFLGSLGETLKLAQQGRISRQLISIANPNIYGNVTLNGSTYQYISDLLNLGNGKYGAKTFNLAFWEKSSGKPGSRTSISSLHSREIQQLVERNGMSPLEAVNKYYFGLQYGLVSGSRVDVPAHGLQVNDKSYTTLDQSANVAQSGDTNYRGFQNQSKEGKQVLILDVPGKMNPLYSTSLPLGVGTEQRDIYIPGTSVIATKQMISQGEGSPNIRGLTDVYNYGMHNAASASNAGRMSNMFARGTTFENLMPRWSAGVAPIGVSLDAAIVANKFRQQMHSRLIYSTYGNMSTAQYSDLAKHSIDRRAGIISNYLLVGQAELDSIHGITEGASAVVRREVIPGVLPELTRSGIEHVETIKLAAHSAEGSIPKSTLEAISKITYTYHGDIKRAKRELGEDIVIGYDYQNPNRKITLGDISDDVSHVEIKTSMIGEHGYIGLTVHKTGYVQQEKDTLKNTVSHYVTPKTTASLFSKSLSSYVRSQYAMIARHVTHVASFEESITKSEGRIALGLIGDVLAKTIDTKALNLNKINFTGSRYIETNKTVDEAMDDYLQDQLVKINNVSDAEERVRLTKLAVENTKKYRYEYGMVLRKKLLEEANASGASYRIAAGVLGISEGEARSAIDRFEYGADSDIIVAVTKPQGMQSARYQLANYHFESTVKSALKSKDSAAELARMLDSAQEEVDKLLGITTFSGSHNRSKSIRHLYKIYRDLSKEEKDQSSLAERSMHASPPIKTSVIYNDGALTGMNMVHNTLGNIHKASDAPTSFAHTSAPGINGYTGGAKITYEGFRNAHIYGAPSLQNYFSSMLTHNTQYVADKVNIKRILKHSNGNALKYAMNMKNLAGNWVYSRDMRNIELQDIGHFATAVNKLTDQSYVIEAIDKVSSEKITTGSSSLTLQGQSLFAEIFGIEKDPSKVDVGDVIEALRSKPQQFAIASEIADELQLAVGGNDLSMIKVPDEIADEVGQKHIPIMRTTKDQKFKFDVTVHLVNQEPQTRTFTTGDATVQANFRLLRQYALAKQELSASIEGKLRNDKDHEKNRKMAIDRIRTAIKEYEMDVSQILGGKGSAAAASVGNFRAPFSGNGRIKSSNKIGFNEVGILRDRYLMMVTHGNISDYDEVVKYNSFRNKASEIVDTIKSAKRSIDFIKDAMRNPALDDTTSSKVVAEYGNMRQSISSLRKTFSGSDLSFSGIKIPEVLTQIDGLLDSEMVDTLSIHETADNANRAVNKIGTLWNSSIEILPEKIRMAELAATAVDEANNGTAFVRVQGYPEINSNSGKYARVKLLGYADEEIYGKSFEALVKDNIRKHNMSRDKAVAAAKKFVMDGMPNFVLNSASAKAISRDFDGDALSFILTSLDQITKSAEKHGSIFREILRSVSQVKSTDVLQQGSELLGLHVESIIHHLADSAVIMRTITDHETGKKTTGYFPASTSSLKAINAIEKSNELTIAATRTQAEVVNEMVTKTLEERGITKGTKGYNDAHHKLVTHITSQLSARYTPFVNDTFADTTAKGTSESILHNVYYLDTVVSTNKVSSSAPIIEEAVSKFKDLGENADIAHATYQQLLASHGDSAVKYLRDKMEIDASRFNLIKGATPTVTSLGEHITNSLIQNTSRNDSLSQFITLVATESLQQKTISSKKGTPYVEGYRAIFGKIADVNHTFTEMDVKNFISSDYEIFMDTKTREIMKKYGFLKNGESHIEETIVKYSDFETYTRAKVEALNTLKTTYEQELEAIHRSTYIDGARNYFEHPDDIVGEHNFLDLRKEAFEKTKARLSKSENPILRNLEHLGIDQDTGYRNIEHFARQAEDDLEKVVKFKHGPELQTWLKKLSQSGKYEGWKEHDIFNEYVKQMRGFLTTYKGDIDTLFRQAMKAMHADYEGRFPDLADIMDRMKGMLVQDPKEANTWHITSDNYSFVRDAAFLSNMENVNIVVHHPNDEHYKRLIENNIRKDRRNMRQYAQAAIDADSTTMRPMSVGDIVTGKPMRVNASRVADELESAMHAHGLMANMLALGAGVLGGMFAQQRMNGYAVPDLKVVEGRGGQYYSRVENTRTRMFGAEAEVFLKKKPIRVVNTIEEGRRQGKLDTYIRNKAIAQRIANREGSSSKRVDSRYAGVVI